MHNPRRASASLKARLGNPNLTHLREKQAARSRRVPYTIFILPLVLWWNRQTIAHLVLRPKPWNYRGEFAGQITNPQLSVLRPKSGNPGEWFWGQTTRTVATGFEDKPGETVDHGFEAKTRNSRSSSPYAQYKPHTSSPDLSIIQPPSTWPVLDHSRSSAPSLLLLPRSSSLPIMPHLSPTHHETSKCVSPHKTDGRVTTKISQIQIQTKASQLLTTNQTKVLTTWFNSMRT
jgi:hypothetical protein